MHDAHRVGGADGVTELLENAAYELLRRRPLLFDVRGEVMALEELHRDPWRFDLLVDARREDYEALSDRIWGMPEIAYTEFMSSAEHTKMLRSEGFAVTEGPAGIPTAVIGEAGRPD